LSKGRKVVTPDLTFHVLTDDPLVHRQLVLDDAGVAILPLYMALEPAVAKRLVPILAGWQPKPVVPCALFAVSSHLMPKVKVFLDFIDPYLGTDRDPRLRSAKVTDCFTGPERDRPALSSE
jgi:DNA-binding transcriptional LysR family regulator